MEVKQIYEIINATNTEVLGDGPVVAEDLSNIVDIGTAVFNSNDVDNYVKQLVDRIGRVVFVNRPYSGGVPSVLMDGWEYGSVMEKISMSLPQAEENESWNLVDGQSYDPHIFYKPTVSAKFFNKKVTFEIPMSFTTMQVKESFSSAEQLNGFLSMIYNTIDKAMTINLDTLVMRTINNMIGETLYAENTDGTYTGRSGIRAVNLLYLYNTANAKALQPAEAVKDPDFIRFASYEMGMYITRMSRISSLFNIGGEPRFTPRDLLHVVLLADFANAADVYLQSGVFHDNLTRLPEAETIPFWQGSGTDYGFNSTSSIDITTASGHAVKASGILGVMFDRDALGVSNMNRRVTSQYNAKAEFFNNWYKMDAGYFNDTNENFVVFYVA